MWNPIQNTLDKNFGNLLRLSPAVENRTSLLWWIAKYFHDCATGKPITLKFKAQDLKHFFTWYVTFKNDDLIENWSKATTNRYVNFLVSERVPTNGCKGKRGDSRRSNRSINRKIDHLKVFSKWVFSQVPSPLVHNPTDGIKRLDVPILEAKRISPKVLEALTTSALHLEGTERSKDLNRYKINAPPLRKTARPARDYAIFALLKGSGLRVQAVCNLNADQVGSRRLVGVREKGSQERNVVISREAYQSIKNYLAAERRKDSNEWEGATALFLSIPQTKRRMGGATGRMDASSLRRVIRKISLRALGEEGAKDIHPHLFRHHIGYVMEKKGGITAVQRQLGHRNLLYSSVYCQKTDEELEKLLDEEDNL